MKMLSDKRLTGAHRVLTLSALCRQVLPLLLLSVSSVHAGLLSPDEEPEGKVEYSTKTLDSHPIGENTEKHLDPNAVFNLWIQDETFFQPHQDDKVEVQKVLEKQAKTFKLENAVKPIPFKSGVADIPQSFVQKLRKLLESMKNRANVRLHFIGHTDTDKLGGATKAKYGDNYGLSKSRAGIAAEFFQRELDLPADAVSYDGAGSSQPIASNNTAAGKARNRRVEVQVWYDEITEAAVDKEVLIKADKLNRLKVCRRETVCKLRYKQGNARRARLRNLIKPLRLAEGETEIPKEFIRQLRDIKNNLSDKENVVIKLVGHTDNLPLEDRDQRIYGGHDALSKARARRVALAIKDALKLSNSQVGSMGKGLHFPVASNDNGKGRALNRRVEVEFWHDDPFEEFTAEAQACPESESAEIITLAYDPPTGPIKAVRFEKGKPIILPGYTDRLKRLMSEITDKSNVRLGLTGYTSNTRMDRRTAMVYGDDIGLSTARARRLMEALKTDMGLTDKQIEYEGKGFVHSDDVVSTGFIQFDGSRVEVEILYDQLAVLEEDEGLDVTRINRETELYTPYALNLMRITVDGETVHDPYKNTADIQRCTDVALEQVDVKFRFENLELKPRLNISAWPKTVRYQDNPETEEIEGRVHFKVYSNYSGFITKLEVRLFEYEQSTRDEPLAILETNKDGLAVWQAEFEKNSAQVKKLKYVLRVYDEKENFDETVEQALWVVNQLKSKLKKDLDIESELLAVYGENRLGLENIPKTGGTIFVNGESIPKDHTVWIAGRPVPVDKDGKFVAEEIFAKGLHTVEVAILDNEGNGELYMRDLEFERSDWFYVALADITLTRDSTNGPAQLITNDTAHYDNDFNFDGRLAFYADGDFDNGWHLTASADTREGPLKDIFSNFTDKSPDALFRRIDPDYFYPSFGDDSTLEEAAATSGKFYVKLSKEENFGLWGNFEAEYTDTDLSHIDRGLYGIQGHYESEEATSFGEKKLVIDGFAAEPGSIAGRDDFRGTGGSLYFLKHQDILTGSDRVRIEIRDKDSGLVIGVKNLTPALDYDIDYIQGRILLTDPLASISSDGLLVDNGSFSGHPVYLVTRYEYTPGFDDLNDITTGGRIHYWFGDDLKLGMTANQQEEAGNENTLTGVDLTLRKNAGTWLKFEFANTQGLGNSQLNSNDGGFNFDPLNTGLTTDLSANAFRIDMSVRLRDYFDDSRGAVTFYVQNREAGFSAPGQLTANDIEQFGGTFNMSITENIDLNVKIDSKDQENSLENASLDTDVSYKMDDNWRFSAGGRLDTRTDNSVTVPGTQKQGDRFDIAFEAFYDSLEDWTTYGFAQVTANATGNREDNNRIGAGASYQVTDRLRLEGELSAGNTGTGAKIGTDYLMSDRTNLYLKYALENERSDNGLRSRQGNMAAGFKSRYSDTVSVYGEERYTHGNVPTGLTHAVGMDVAPDEHWNYGASLEMGTLEDKNTAAETDRTALGLTLGYIFDDVKYSGAVEYRADTSEAIDTSISKRTTWLWKNTFKYQINPDWRFIGKLNHSDSESSKGEFYDGNFTEAVLGYGYRPVSNDIWNTLFKYTYFFNKPTTEQVTVENTAVEFIQKSHIFAIDTIYDLSQRWSIGGKYAYRLGQLSLDRLNPEFFDSNASLYVLRADWHFVNRWDMLIEARMLDLPEAQDRRSGMLFGLYRHIGKNFKFGLGYNFTDFSDDLTDLDFDSQGLFINLIAKM
jgi:flagellar motor protein MotB